MSCQNNLCLQNVGLQVGSLTASSLVQTNCIIYSIDKSSSLQSWEWQLLDIMMIIISVVRYPRYLDTYRRYLRDDTSIAEVTIYRGIS